MMPSGSREILQVTSHIASFVSHLSTNAKKTFPRRDNFGGGGAVLCCVWQRNIALECNFEFLCCVVCQGDPLCGTVASSMVIQDTVSIHHRHTVTSSSSIIRVSLILYVHQSRRTAGMKYYKPRHRSPPSRQQRASQHSVVASTNS